MVISPEIEDYLGKVYDYLEKSDQKSTDRQSLLNNKLHAYKFIDLLDNNELAKSEKKRFRPILDFLIKNLECADDAIHKIDSVFRKIFAKECQHLDDLIDLSDPSQNLDILAKRLENNPLAIHHLLVKGSSELLSALLRQQFPLFSWLSDSPTSVVLLLKKLQPHEYHHIPTDILAVAAKNGYLAIFRELLSYPAHLLKPMLQGEMTPLHIAAWYGQSAVIALLLRTMTRRVAAGELQSEDLQPLLTIDKQGKTPLAWAVLGHYLEAVRLLISDSLLSAEQLATLFTANPTTGSTPLHLCAQNCHDEYKIMNLMVPQAPEETLIAHDLNGNMFLNFLRHRIGTDTLIKFMDLLKTKIESPSVQAELIDLYLRVLNDHSQIRPMLMHFWEKNPQGFLLAAMKYKTNVLPFLITEANKEVKSILSSTSSHELPLDEADRKDIADRLSTIERNRDYFHARWPLLTPVVRKNGEISWQDSWRHGELSIQLKENRRGYCIKITGEQKGKMYKRRYRIDPQTNDLKFFMIEIYANYLLDATPVSKGMTTLSFAALPALEKVNGSVVDILPRQTELHGADVDQYLQLWTDHHKHKILEKAICVFSDSDIDDKHYARFIYYSRLLQSEGIAFPNYRLDKYDLLENGDDDDDIIEYFYESFTVDSLAIYWQNELNAIMRDPSNMENPELATKVQTLLSAGARNILLDHYPTEKEALELLESKLNVANQEDGDREQRRDSKLLVQKVDKLLWNIVKQEELITEDANQQLFNGITFKGALLLGIQTGLFQISSQEQFKALFRDVFPLKANFSQH